MKAGDSHYQDRVVRLHDLLPDSGPPIIKGFTFDGCHIMGPAVVVLAGAGNLMNCAFDGPPEHICIQLVADQDTLIGAIMLEDCSFDRCRFVGVGFVDKNGELRSRFAA